MRFCWLIWIEIWTIQISIQNEAVDLGVSTHKVIRVKWSSISKRPYVQVPQGPTHTTSSNISEEGVQPFTNEDSFQLETLDDDTKATERSYTI